MRRFYCAVLKGSSDGHPITLSGKEAHHLSRVTRLSAGELCELIDGEGHRASARVEVVSRNAVLLKQVGKTESVQLHRTRLSVAQALTRRQKLDWMVEKAQELAVDSLILVVSCRTELRPEAERFMKMRERFERISRSSAKQCGNARLVRIEAPILFDELLQRRAQVDRAWILTPQADRSLAGLLEPRGEQARGEHVLLAIGPEGGFSEEETLRAVSCGFAAARLGAFALRADTALVVAVGMVRNLLP